jgi:4-aminobutyrate aminotransferase/(S)-3-amino-2-methylpropionate transaminase
MVAVELVRDRKTLEPAKEETQRIVRSACERGVLLISAGTLGNVIRFLAPLVITDEELDEALDVITVSFADTMAVPAK